MSRIGILGGTFNPPHNGHIQLAKAALDGLSLDSLLVVPANHPPHKEVADEPGAEVRYDLCEAAFAGIENVAVSRIELDRDEPSWMVETLNRVRSANPNEDLYLILGEDAALSLPSWNRPEEIVSQATIAWVPRADGVSHGDVAQVVRSLGSRIEAEPLKMDPVAVSSTAIRELVERGDDIRDFVPASVASMVSDRGLYHRKSL